MEKNRFFWAKSLIYGNTVYDRTTQTPAYEYGASHNMTKTSCVILKNHLNRLDRTGKVEAYRDELREKRMTLS